MGSEADVDERVLISPGPWPVPASSALLEKGSEGALKSGTGNPPEAPWGVTVGGVKGRGAYMRGAELLTAERADIPPPVFPWS